MATAAKEKDVVLHPKENITEGAIETFRQELADVIDQGAKQITIDLGAVETIDIMGVSLIISACKSLSHNDGKLTLVTDNPDFRHLFEILHLDKQLSIKGTK
jgi:anti-anti-sigma factor